MVRLSYYDKETYIEDENGIEGGGIEKLPGRQVTRLRMTPLPVGSVALNPFPYKVLLAILHNYTIVHTF